MGGQGYQKDPDSGLMLLGARYYDPSVGRFISRDPIGYSGGLNLYGYCGNDPVNQVDPSGHYAQVGLLMVVLAVAIVAFVGYEIWWFTRTPEEKLEVAYVVSEGFQTIGDTFHNIGDRIQDIGHGIGAILAKNWVDYKHRKEKFDAIKEGSKAWDEWADTEEDWEKNEWGESPPPKDRKGYRQPYNIDDTPPPEFTP